MEGQIRALSLGFPLTHTHNHHIPKPHQTLAPHTQLLQASLSSPSSQLFPLAPNCFMPLFSQCEKFDNVHKRNSRTAAGYGNSTCGSSLPLFWRRLGICSFIDLFRAGRDDTIKALCLLPYDYALRGLKTLF